MECNSCYSAYCCDSQYFLFLIIFLIKKKWYHYNWEDCSEHAALLTFAAPIYELKLTGWVFFFFLQTKISPCVGWFHFWLTVFCSQAHHASQCALQLSGPVPQQVRQHISPVLKMTRYSLYNLTGPNVQLDNTENLQMDHVCLFYHSAFLFYPVERYCWSDLKCTWPTMGTTESCAGSHLGTT